MKIYLITALVFAAAWLAAWFAFIRPALKRYELGARIVARLDEAEGNLWAKVKIWLEAKKTVLLSFFGSGFAAFKAAVGLAAAGATATVKAVDGLSPSDIIGLGDKSVWATLVGESASLYIVSAIALLTAFLTLKGKLAALFIEPTKSV